MTSVFMLEIETSIYFTYGKLIPLLSSGSALFVIKYLNLYEQLVSSNLIGCKLEVGVAS